MAKVVYKKGVSKALLDMCAGPDLDEMRGLSPEDKSIQTIMYNKNGLDCVEVNDNGKPKSRVFGWER